MYSCHRSVQIVVHPEGYESLGLDVSLTSESHYGIDVIKRVALPSMSSNTSASPKSPVQNPLERLMERE